MPLQRDPPLAIVTPVCSEEACAECVRPSTDRGPVAPERRAARCPKPTLIGTLIVNQAHLLHTLREYETYYKRAPAPPRAARRGTPTPAPPADHRTRWTRPPRHPTTRPTRRRPPRIPTCRLSCTDHVFGTYSPMGVAAGGKLLMARSALGRSATPRRRRLRWRTMNRRALPPMTRCLIMTSGIPKYSGRAPVAVAARIARSEHSAAGEPARPKVTSDDRWSGTSS
jgi:hypothetical protein